jgi:hypothetical protein
MERFKPKKGLIFIGLIVFSIVFQSCKTEKTEVILCGTLHAFHKNNPEYTYEDIFEYIEALDPDIIGVEIRPEDLQLPDSLLRQFYPYEMIEVLIRFDDIPIYGIDWWDQHAKGNPVSNGLIDSLRQVCLEKQLNRDSSMLQKRPPILDTLRNLKIQMAVGASMQSILYGRFDSINAAYYREFEAYVKNSEYHELYTIYMQRHHKIGQNMLNLIENHQGKRLFFLVGAEHQVFARNILEAKLDSNCIAIIK